MNGQPATKEFALALGRLSHDLKDPLSVAQTPSFLLTDLSGAAASAAGFRSDQGLGLLFAGVVVRALGGTPSVERRSDGPGALFRLRFEDVD